MEKIKSSTSLLCTILLLLPIVIGACSHHTLYPFPDNGITVDKNRLVYRDNPNRIFAELQLDKSSYDDAIYGVKLYFYDSQKEIWIYPEKGQLELDRNMSQKLLTVITNVRFSEDGKYVLYNEPGLFSDSLKKFDIATGTTQ